MQAVHVSGPADMIGGVAPVAIVAAGSNSLAGRLLGKGEEAKA
jgi:tRNA-2-methylthio-N6-dimethylallyladenosine synthase